MANLFELVIATPEREVYRNQVDSVTVPTLDGEITVLAHHLPLTTVLKPGELVIRQAGKSEPYAVGGGFLEVRDNRVMLLADTAEHIEQLEEQRVHEAIARAQKIKEEKQSAESVEYARMAAKLERDLARLKVIRKYGHQGRGITHQGIRPE